MLTEAGHFWTQPPAPRAEQAATYLGASTLPNAASPRVEPPRSAPAVAPTAPQTRRERRQRAGAESAPERQWPEARREHPATGSFTAALTPADGLHLQGPSTGSVPATRASRRSSPSTTELEIIRGRRAARPQTTRRRAELALGRTMGNRRLWGGVLTVALVLLVPGASMLTQNSVTVADGGLSSGGSNLAALRQFPDATRLAQPTADEATAKARAKATAAAAAKKATATATAAARRKKAARSRVPAGGSVGSITNGRSGLPWGSGVFSRGQGVAGIENFGAWRGAGVDVAIDWSARNDWNDIVNPAFIFTTWKNTPYTKVIGVAPIPEGDGSATMAGCAAGSYNDKWRQFGQNFKNAGMDDDTVIRLGWEFNGDWFKWSAHDPGQFAECWRQIVGTVRQVAPKLLWDWNVNRSRGASVTDARQAYPGDAYVDIVGVDSYDMWPGVTNASAWDVHLNGPYGLKFWSSFARQHGKKMSVPEWGVYPGPGSNGANGGDNAFYIGKMYEFFKSQGSHLAYESYFNEDASYVAASIFGPTQNPSAAAKYKSLFGR
jgi:hypothetical protein